uniref:Cytochrome c peroxidase n=1 Tax=Roseihalotalea indica TaxID=2867963 RepID=A0AA49GR37_9BACT|nr:cytochrome c peroxidase [Tunicatimonas sp. TK19036]
MQRYFLLALTCLSFLSSCQQDPEAPVQKKSLLDQQLAQALQAASRGKGISFFRLPDSDDFSQIPQDPNNFLTNEKVALGKLLYHETALAVKSKFSEGMRTYSCASCHHAQAGFQAGTRQGVGDGGTGFGVAGEGRKHNILFPTDSIDVQPVRSPSTLNSAYQVVQLWNGQFGATGPNEGTENQWKKGTPIETNHLGFEGVETQAIAGLTVHRLNCDTALIAHTAYKQYFDRAFSQTNEKERYALQQAGLAIAAYERTLLANQAPFQRYLRGETAAISEHQKQGALLFFGKANCTSCHTGPALNSMEFHALGMGDLLGDGVHRNTTSDPAHRGRSSFTGKSEDDYKFKVPQLYNLKDSPFYGHGGTFHSVQEVIMYKNEADPENAVVPDSQLAKEFVPLNLNEEEVQQLTDFVENALYDPHLSRYVPDSLPSGLCFPNNDAQTRTDLNFGE